MTSESNHASSFQVPAVIATYSVRKKKQESKMLFNFFGFAELHYGAIKLMNEEEITQKRKIILIVRISFTAFATKMAQVVADFFCFNFTVRQIINHKYLIH